ncbi:hypothetical protein M378DRAFT_171566 [Amanita muscaria Koide BX008]|uniref:Uncharacterized protein n=1 Tax=Amanita muscaria (strain Koide BX008) TaxID=946122 RepID=A0A0C2WN15_AMAMK|nr:hypothetical protein M378DRAFT_171566 [Amanita muscaria Koide BX008]
MEREISGSLAMPRTRLDCRVRDAQWLALGRNFEERSMDIWLPLPPAGRAGHGESTATG